MTIPGDREILTTTVGSYSPIDWLISSPSEQAIVDATSVVIQTQKRAGIDLPTDGELYRFDADHPETNGMIEYFTRRLGGIRSQMGRSDYVAFRSDEDSAFRRKPAGVVMDDITEGVLDLPGACERSSSVADGPLKFTLTSPYMLARMLTNTHYEALEDLVLALADALAAQVADIDAACIQIDEANLPGTPEHAPLAQEAINRILDAAIGEKAVHLCFGNYGGQTVQAGAMADLIGFLNGLHTDHLVLEMAHRPASDLDVLTQIDPRIALGVGVIDIKVNHIESPDDVAARIDRAVDVLGAGRVRWVQPDCGFWMLRRPVADAKISALGAGRDLFLGDR